MSWFCVLMFFILIGVASACAALAYWIGWQVGHQEGYRQAARELSRGVGYLVED